MEPNLRPLFEIPQNGTNFRPESRRQNAQVIGPVRRQANRSTSNFRLLALHPPLQGRGLQVREVRRTFRNLVQLYGNTATPSFCAVFVKCLCHVLLPAWRDNKIQVIGIAFARSVSDKRKRLHTLAVSSQRYHPERRDTAQRAVLIEKKQNSQIARPTVGRPPRRNPLPR